MTIERRDGGGTPFNEWVRALPTPLDASSHAYQDVDGTWFAYREGWVILLEVKAHRMSGSTLIPDSQWDLFCVLTQMLAQGAGIVATLRGERPIEFRGGYVLFMNGDTPATSSWVKIKHVDGHHGDRVESRAFAEDEYCAELVQYLLEHGSINPERRNT